MTRRKTKRTKLPEPTGWRAEMGLVWTAVVRLPGKKRGVRCLMSAWTRPW